MGHKAKDKASELTLLAIATLIGISAYTSKTLVDDTRASIKTIDNRYYSLNEKTNDNIKRINDSLTSLTVKVEILLADRKTGGIESRIANSTGSSPSPL